MKKILLVDDDITLQTALTRYLEQRGYHVITAASGLEALSLFEKDPPDLIISDIIMPEMDGFKFCQRIRADKLGELIPFLFLSSRGEVDDRVQGHNIGADDYLVKPFHPKELVAKIEAQLERSRRIYAAIVRLLSKGSDALNLENPDFTSHELKNSSLNISNPNIEVSELAANSSIIQEELEMFEHASNQKYFHKGKYLIDKDKEDFIGFIAHKLKGNFLNIGNSNREISALTANSNEIQEECQIIERSSKKSQILLRNLIDYLGLGKTIVEVVDLRLLIKELIEIESPLLRSNIVLEASYEKSLEDQDKIYVTSNYEQLLGIVSGLIENSRKALHSQGGKISILVSQTNKDIEIVISDNGPGIPNQIKNKLFNQEIASKDGLGIGLYLSKKVIKNLNGDINLKPSFEGTCFLIKTPKHKTSLK